VVTELNKGCAVRALFGIAIAIGAGLFGVEHMTVRMSGGNPLAGVSLPANSLPANSLAINSTAFPLMGASTSPALQANLAMIVATDTTVYQTVAAADPMPLPQVQAAPPNAPRAEPINPIVAPVQRVAPKTVAPKAAVDQARAVKARAGAKSVNAKVATGKAATGKPKVAAQPKSTERGVGVTRGTSSGRPGFKLSCTSAQKLDAVRQRCVPLKSQAGGVVKAV
jgi:hypothetical protein